MGVGEWVMRWGSIALTPLPPGCHRTIHAVNIKTLRLYVSEEGSEEAAVEYGDSFTVNPTFTRVFRAFWV